MVEKLCFFGFEDTRNLGLFLEFKVAEVSAVESKKSKEFAVASG
jgi:hypothetical protein